MSTSDDHVDVDGYIEGSLDEEEARHVDAHVASCPVCARDVATLREAQELLRGLPPEALLDGPPEDAALLLQRTLRQARSETVRSRTGRVPLRPAEAFGAAAAAVVLLVVGAAAGRMSVPGPQEIAAPAAPPPPGVSAPSDVRFASALDSRTGARLTVRVMPADGWFRINAAVTGIPVGEPCHLVVIGRDGRKEVAGGWLVSEDGATGGVTLDGSALMSMDDAAAVVVENTSGRQFVQVDI